MRRMRRCGGAWGTVWIVVCVALAGRSAAAQDQEVPPKPEHRQGNVWGINLGWHPGSGTVATVRMLGQARTLVGDWGYIRHGVSPRQDVAQMKRDIAMIRAHRLINLAGGAYPDKRFAEEGKPIARLGDDGTFREAAADRARDWALMYEAKIPWYAVEVMNEVNMHNSIPPERYARWLYDFAVEVKKAYPGLLVCSAGMAGSGADYYDRMLDAMPELKQVVDLWGCHPYGANNPPEKEPAETTLRSYVLTADVLAKHGVDPVRIMCTETGYELEIGDVGKNNAYPPIKEDNRAEYMARAFRDYYVPDPRIEMVAPFMLWDLPWHGWDGWNYIGHDGRPKPIFYASAAEPKPHGRDFMPTGRARIEGRITWRETDIGVPRMIVYTEPGFYGGVTDDTGRYAITDLPAGTYTVRAFADGYRSPAPARVSATAGKPGRYDVRVERASLVAHSFGEPGQPAPSAQLHGWELISRDLNARRMRLDDRHRDRKGRPTLRWELGSRPNDFGIYRYGPLNSAYPNEVYVAEVYVRAEGKDETLAEDAGPFLEVSMTNGRGELLATSRITPAAFRADGEWYRLTAAVLAPERASRVRIDLGVKAGTGTYWFGAPFVGEADFPLPTDVDYGTTGYVPPLYEINKDLFAQTIVDVDARNPDLKKATLFGKVNDFRGRPVPYAVVATDDPLFVDVCDELGNYELIVPADREVCIRAFAAGLETVVSRPVTLKEGLRAHGSLECPPPDAPAELQNGGFNDFVKDAPGLMIGWKSFGATDGTVGSTKMIFEVPSYEGEGLYAAQSGSNVKNGGAYQTIQAEKGRTYRLTGRVYTRTEGKTKKPLDNNCRLGIDPTGGHDPTGDDIVWTDPTESDKEWTEISVQAEAQTERITIFIRHEMRRANTWNLTLFDDLRLDVVPD